MGLKNTFCPVASYPCTGFSVEVHKPALYRRDGPDLGPKQGFHKQLAAPQFLAIPERNFTAPEKGSTGRRRSTLFIPPRV